MNAIRTLKQERPVSNIKTGESFMEGSNWHVSGKIVKSQISRSKGKVCLRKRGYCIQGYRGKRYKVDT